MEYQQESLDRDKALVILENGCIVSVGGSGDVSLRRGVDIVIRDGIVRELGATGRSRFLDRAAATHIVLDDSSIVTPLAFNSHIHLTLPPISADLKPLPRRGKYSNASEWIDEQDELLDWKHLQAVSIQSAMLNCEQNLAEGVGSLVGHGKPEIYHELTRRYPTKILLASSLSNRDLLRRFKRPVEHLSNDDIRALLSQDPLGHRYMIAGVHSYYASSRELARSVYAYALQNALPFYGHFGEGVDDAAVRELEYLLEDNLIENTIIVHGVAFSVQPSLIEQFKNVRGIVWCLSANRDLFGHTAPIRDFLKNGLTVAIGTDSGFAGSHSFAEEIQLILAYARENSISVEEIFKMAFYNPYIMFDPTSSFLIAEGKPANFRVVRSRFNLTDANRATVIEQALAGRTFLSVIDGQLVDSSAFSQSRIQLKADSLFRRFTAGRFAKG